MGKSKVSTKANDAKLLAELPGVISKYSINASAVTECVCSRCGETLTDEVSRVLLIGPICRAIENDVYATFIPANVEAAKVALGRVVAGLRPKAPEPVIEVLAAVVDRLVPTVTDHRATVRCLEWLLGFGHVNEHREAVCEAIKALGYGGVAALLSGEATKFAAEVRFDAADGRIYFRAANKKAPPAPARAALKAINGWKFHGAEGDKPAEWSFPGAELKAFWAALNTYWPNHNGKLVTLLAEVGRYLDAKKAAEVVVNASAGVIKAAEAVAVKPASKPCFIYVTKGAVKVATPYNAAFVAELKEVVPWEVRKWNAAEKLWVVADAYRGAVEGLIEKHFHCAATVS